MFGIRFSTLTAQFFLQVKSKPLSIFFPAHPGNKTRCLYRNLGIFVSILQIGHFKECGNSMFWFLFLFTCGTILPGNFGMSLYYGLEGWSFFFTKNWTFSFWSSICLRNVDKSICMLYLTITLARKSAHRCTPFAGHILGKVTVAK